MSKQRVKILRFRVGSGNQTTYKVLGSREFTTLYGRFRIEQDALIVWPEQDFDDIELAIEQVAPLLRSWEIRAGLEFGPDSLSFTFEAAELEQARGTPGTSDDPPIVVQLTSQVVMRDDLTGHLTRHDYPPPPMQGDFAMSEYLALAYHRWRNYVHKHEPLPSMAYFICTIFEQLGGGSRKGAASTLKIDYAVLDTLARLSSVAGDANSMRKFDVKRSPTEMTDAERAWLEQVVKRLIRRLGEYAAVAPLVRITMADFPTLP